MTFRRAKKRHGPAAADRDPTASEFTAHVDQGEIRLPFDCPRDHRALAGEQAPKPAAERAAGKEPSRAPVAASNAPKRGSAQQSLLTHLSRPEGATIAELQQATGWQPHSVRGALSGIVRKKLGHEVTSSKEERGRVYRIAS